MRMCSAVLIWVLAAPAFGTGQSRSPSVYFENTSRDSGKVTQGETITQIFKFINKGPGILQILNVAHS